MKDPGVVWFPLRLARVRNPETASKLALVKHVQRSRDIACISVSFSLRNEPTRLQLHHEIHDAVALHASLDTPVNPPLQTHLKRRLSRA
eukprot:3705421-Amphidinium_carterae.1